VAQKIDPPKSVFICGEMLSAAIVGLPNVASCEDLDERFRRHNLGHSKATRHGVPWTLVHTETFSNRADATRREQYYK
jgi:hypothetical protein